MPHTDAQSPRTLQIGRTVEHELTGGESHDYDIYLTAGNYLKLEVEQRGIDLVVLLYGPTGEKLSEVDLQKGWGPEPIALEVTNEGIYRLKVRSPAAPTAAGRYGLKSATRPTAAEQDRDRGNAVRLLAEAASPEHARTAESARGVLRKREEALSLWRRIPDKYWEAYTLHAIGTSLGEQPPALEYFSQALAVRREIGDRPGEAGTLNNIGNFHADSREPDKALEFYYQSLELKRTLPDRRGEALTLNNIGTIYRSLGEHGTALEYYNLALPFLRAAGDRRAEVAVLGNVGNAHASLGQYEKALDYIGQTIPMLRAFGDRVREAAAINNIGVLCHEMRDYDKALDFHRRALSIRREIEDRGGETESLSNIGRAYEALGEEQQAREHYEQVLERNRSAGSREGEAGTLSQLARLDSARGSLAEAHTLSKAALDIFESLRTKILNRDVRDAYSATIRECYDLHIDVLMRLHKEQPSQGFDVSALQASERARARGLLELLTEARADIRHGVDPQLLASERSLERQISDKAEAQVRLLGGKNTGEEAEKARKGLAELMSERERVDAQIRRNSPRYAALVRPAALNLAHIQRRLDADTLLLEYALGEQRSYLWAVTPDVVNSYELPPGKDIEAAARRVYELLTARNRRGRESEAQYQARIAEADAEYASAARTLSRMVLSPAAAELGTKRLVIVADGALQYVPFAALPEPMSDVPAAVTSRNARPRTDEGGGLDYHPLIVKHELVSVPSASTLDVLRRETEGRVASQKAVAVLADPVFGADDPRLNHRGGKPSVPTRIDTATVDTSSQSAPPRRPPAASTTRQPDGAESYSPTTRLLKGLTGERGGLARLAFSREEARFINSVAPAGQTFVATDFEASQRTALSDQLAQYRYVHFATHGVLNAQHPELSGIVLTLVDEHGNPQDGFLGLSDIYNLRLPVEMVVLSGCQTALGKEIKGEGLVGLTRGFMYAGAKQVMASLWKVEDAATAELMKRVYLKMLQDGERPAAALGKAQLEMQSHKQWREPYHWAGFIIQGDWK